MKLYILFGQRKESYDGEHGPEVLLAWDGFTVDENPEGFEKAVVDAKKENAVDMIAMRVIAIDVPQHRIRSLLMHTPEVVGSIIDSKEAPCVRCAAGDHGKCRDERAGGSGMQGVRCGCCYPSKKE